MMILGFGYAAWSIDYQYGVWIVEKNDDRNGGCWIDTLQDYRIRYCYRDTKHGCFLVASRYGSTPGQPKPDDCQYLLHAHPHHQDTLLSLT